MAKAARKSARPKRAKASGQSGRDPVLEAAMRLAAENGWRGLTLSEIADAAGLSLADLHARYPSRQAILEGIRHHADRAMLAGGAAADGSARDRLFEVLMRRFDALGPWRPGIAAVIEDACRDPIALVCGGTGALASMAVALEAAGLDSAGFRGLVRAKALAAVWLPALRVWLSDETQDRAATMATLDKGLRRLDAVVRFCRAPFAAGHQAETTA